MVVDISKADWRLFRERIGGWQEAYMNKLNKDLTQPFCFTGSTDEEYSLVCPEEMVMENTAERDDGWRGFRIVGPLDFSLIGILAQISKILAGEGIGIFVISTYNTDYILTKEENFEKALRVLKESGYEMKSGR